MKVKPLFLAASAIAILSSPVQASLIVTCAEVGSNVIFTATGSINTTGLAVTTNGATGCFINSMLAKNDQDASNLRIGNRLENEMRA